MKGVYVFSIKGSKNTKHFLKMRSYKLHFCLFQTDDGYLYGYVYFRQVKDRTLRRGYFQKVMVHVFVDDVVANQSSQWIIKTFMSVGVWLFDAGSEKIGEVMLIAIHFLLLIKFVGLLVMMCYIYTLIVLLIFLKYELLIKFWVLKCIFREHWFWYWYILVMKYKSFVNIFFIQL